MPLIKATCKISLETLHELFWCISDVHRLFSTVLFRFSKTYTRQSCSYTFSLPNSIYKILRFLLEHCMSCFGVFQIFIDSSLQYYFVFRKRTQGSLVATLSVHLISFIRVTFNISLGSLHELFWYTSDFHQLSSKVLFPFFLRDTPGCLIATFPISQSEN